MTTMNIIIIVIVTVIHSHNGLSRSKQEHMVLNPLEIGWYHIDTQIHTQQGFTWFYHVLPCFSLILSRRYLLSPMSRKQLPSAWSFQCRARYRPSRIPIRKWLVIHILYHIIYNIHIYNIHIYIIYIYIHIYIYIYYICIHICIYMYIHLCSSHRRSRM